MSTTAWWIVGWAAGALVVVIAAGLLLTIIALARRIVRQAGEITAALEGARAHTEPLVALAEVNRALDRIARGLRGEAEPEEPERSIRSRVAASGEEPR